MKAKLTKTSVARLRAPTASGRQEITWDDELKGFGVLLSGVTNSKTYIAQRRVDGRTRRVTVAQVGEIEVEEARVQAGRALNDMRQGKDPKAEARARRGGPTLEEAMRAYIAASVDLKQRTKDDYQYAVRGHLGDWLGRKLREITAEMVLRRHEKIQHDVAQGGANAKTTGAAAANGCMRTLSAIWNAAAASDAGLPSNPTAALRRRWFRVRRRERLVRADDLPKFHRAVLALPNAVQRDFILLLLFTGLRRTSAASLRVDDLDFAGGVVRLSGKKLKSGRALDLVMTSHVREILLRRKAAARDGWLFPADSESGHLMEPKGAFEAVEQACGVKVSAHDMKRTFVSVASATVGITPHQLKMLADHALGDDVTSGYVVALMTDLRGAAQLVADRMKLLCGIAEEKRGKVTRFAKKVAR